MEELYFLLGPCPEVKSLKGQAVKRKLGGLCEMAAS
jgi:hypothetical protein